MRQDFEFCKCPSSETRVGKCPGGGGVLSYISDGKVGIRPNFHIPQKSSIEARNGPRKNPAAQNTI